MKAIFEKFIFSFTMILATLGMLWGITSCVEEEMPYIVLDQEEIEVGTEAEKYTINVKSNISWTATCAQEWIQLYNPEGQYKGEFDFEVQANETTQIRTAIVSVSSPDGSVMANVQVVQAPKKAGLFLTEEKVNFGMDGGKHKIRVVSNHDWNILSSEEWCTVTPAEGKSSGEFEITAEKNLAGEARKATVSVICEVNVEQPIIRNIEVLQSGKDFYFNFPTKNFYFNSDGQDIMVPYDSSDPEVEIRISSEEDWIGEIIEPLSVKADTPQRDICMIHALPNYSGEDRTAKVTFTILSEGQEPLVETLEFFQSATDFYFALPVKKFNLRMIDAGEELMIPFETNDPEVEIEMSSDVSWIDTYNGPQIMSTKVAAQDIISDYIIVYTEPNLGEETRSGKLILSISSFGQKVRHETIEIVQEGMEWYFTIPTKEYNLDKRRDTLFIVGDVSAPMMNFATECNAQWLTVMKPEDLENMPEPPHEIVYLQGNSLQAVRPGDDMFKETWVIIVDENKVKETRTGKVTFSARAPFIPELGKVPGEPIVETVTINQTGDELTLNVPVKEYHVDAYVDQPLTLQWQATEAAVNYKTNVEWIELEGDPYGSPQVYAMIEPNMDPEPRHGQVVFFTNKLGLEQLSQTVDIYQEGYQKDYVAFSAEEMNINPSGETVTIPFTGSYEPEVTLSNEDWSSVPELDFMDGAGTVKLTLDPNYSGLGREMIVTLTISDPMSEIAVSSSIKLIQKSEEVKFKLSAANLTMDFNNAEKYITIESMTDWQIQAETVPAWLQITPMEGTGNQAISFKAEKNELPVERSTNIIIATKDNTKSITLPVNQSGNPDVIDTKLYGFLGRGYKASGLYAHNKDVKAPVLDIKKLYAGNFLEDIKPANQAEETVITGTDRATYIANYTKAGQVKENVTAYMEAVTRNFTANALKVQEQQFGTIRQVYKKEIVKLYDGTTAANIKECINDGFANDVQKLTAEQLVMKYGTHVLTGLSMGAALEYNMSANIFNLDADFNKALREGYGKAYHGASVSDIFNTVHNNAGDFEQKLLVNGGNASALQENCEGNDQNAYETWVASLADRSAWVLAGIEGPGLMPLWEFIADAGKQAQVRTLIENGFTAQLPAQESTLFEPKVGLTTFATNMKNATNTSTWNWKIGLFHKDQESVVLHNTAELAEAPVFTWSDTDAAASYTIDPATVISSKVKFSSKVKNQKMTVKISGLACTDPENLAFTDTDIDFTYEPAEAKWRCSADNQLYSNGDLITLKIENGRNWWTVQTKIE